MQATSTRANIRETRPAPSCFLAIVFGRTATPRSGVNSTATIHQTIQGHSHDDEQGERELLPRSWS